ncbi:hypothetical protein QAD02_013225 [Eretmocerus hayati]|uniref:Uncharacterized protein n=1 Tax=Eretmocerus hayati TaxID=131215 RepID=A0ACC2P1U5_9HYME|nr:hypothetical protein QAD02_013225 [Eretmocerus hayati]
MLSLVAEFASPTARDFVLAKASGLKDHTVQTIFRTKGPSSIHLSPVLPYPVYKIRRSALAKAKGLSHLRPSLIDMTVHMKADCKCAPVPILAVEEFSRLPVRVVNMNTA